MLKLILGIGSVSLPLFCDIDPSGGWITSIGGFGLAALLCLNVIPRLVKTNADAAKENARMNADALKQIADSLDSLAQSVVMLRVHCAAKYGEPGELAPKP